MSTFKKFISKPITVSIGLIIISQLGAFGLRQSAKNTGSKLIAPLDSISEIQATLTGSDYGLSAKESVKIKKLNDMIFNHKEHHKQTFLTVYQFHYSSVAQLTIFSIITGLLTFLVGQRGWKETTPMIRTLFLTCGALTSFFALSINVFQQDVSIKRNLDSYIQYDNLQKEILNYCSTEPRQNLKGDTLTFSQFHTYAVNRLVKINNIYLEFDKDAVETNYQLDQ